MVEYAPLELPDTPRLADNITHFARALRRAGLPIGPGRVGDALRAVEAAGFTCKQDFFWTLQACFVSRPEHRSIFAQVFRLYWRDPRFLEHMMGLLLPAVQGVQEDRKPQAGEKRAAQALLENQATELPAAPKSENETEIEINAAQTMSPNERLRHLDFEQMSIAEIAQAKSMLARLKLPVKPLISRRTVAASLGRWVDRPATLRSAIRHGGDLKKLHMRKSCLRWPDLVILCDISGSMRQYSRMVLHFAHAVANQKGAGWARVHSFTFGTRLTNISRQLQTKDVDAALAAAGAEAKDWDGGTRIAACLHAFNRDWSRRVLGQGALVLLITDGLETEQGADLSREMQRLRLSARRLIWLNPLLRWDKFEVKAGGIKAMLPHVDSFRSAHSIASLQELATVISEPEEYGEKRRLL
ncbi:MAG: vWA domain-containing protein [Paracoccaceae bacterium]